MVPSATPYDLLFFRLGFTTPTKSQNAAARGLQCITPLYPLVSFEGKVAGKDREGKAGKGQRERRDHPSPTTNSWIHQCCLLHDTFPSPR